MQDGNELVFVDKSTMEQWRKTLDQASLTPPVATVTAMYFFCEVLEAATVAAHRGDALEQLVAQMRRRVLPLAN